jgi:hypothetical protein
MNPPLELRILGSDWDALHQHLFPGDDDEHGAVLLCGQATTERTRRLLVRDVILANDGVDYVPGARGYRHLSGAFVTHQLRRAKDQGLVYLAVHNHGGRGVVGFSQADIDSHERGYPTLLAISGQPVGALVVADDAVAADIWFPDQRREALQVTTVIGDELLDLTDGYTRQPRLTAAGPSVGHSRQALLFGEAGQGKLAGLRVGVVGVGGVGMLLVQALSRLGVGHLIVIDPDVVSVSNLSRLPETSSRDAGIPRGILEKLRQRIGRLQAVRKVVAAERLATRANPTVNVDAIADDVANDRVAKQLRDCDFIFLAADTMLARDVVNQIAYQYLIPTLQVGSKVVLDPSNGNVLDVFSVIRSVGTSPGCLRCNQLVDAAKLTEEAVADPTQRANQRYVDDPDVAAPSVITINAVGSGWAANDFMHYATGLGRPSTGYRILRTRPVGNSGQHMTVQVPATDPHCHVCGPETHSARARGDSVDLPTRLN